MSVKAFVSFPSEYTHNSVIRAFKKYLPDVELVFNRPSEVVDIQYADYDLIEFDWVMQNQNCISSSYCFRKALTRKNYLHKTIEAYLAKVEHRIQVKAIDKSEEANVNLLKSAMPSCWTIDIAHSDDLDEVLMDDLYDLSMSMNENEGSRWFILKPAMADRANGIRLFNNEESLRSIFEEFDDSDSEEEDGDEKQQSSTAISTSQLRQFVIQEYISNPLLIDPTNKNQQFHKFHLRVYVLCVGSIKVYMPKDMLALFASKSYKEPNEDQSLLSHLTNSCLQGENMDRTTFVKSVNELEGLKSSDGSVITKQRINNWVESSSKVIGQCVKGAIESGSVNFQPIPNSFEIFGVDLLITDNDEVKLLEFNGCPDFGQTGDRLSYIVDDVIDLSFGLFLNRGSKEHKDNYLKCLEFEFRRGW